MTAIILSILAIAIALADIKAFDLAVDRLNRSTLWSLLPLGGFALLFYASRSTKV